MNGVGSHVHDDLVNLRGVRKYCRRFWTQTGVNIDHCGNGGTEKLQCLCCDKLQFDALPFRFMLPAERENLADEIGSPSACAADNSQFFLRWMIRRNVTARQFCVAHDRRQDVIEVMSNAAGKDAEAFQSLRKNKTRLEVFLFRDVGVD